MQVGLHMQQDPGELRDQSLAGSQAVQMNGSDAPLGPVCVLEVVPGGAAETEGTVQVMLCSN